jgi:hypothetical protein
LAILILLVAMILGIAKWDSIVTGPSGDDAIVALRVVERELAEAQHLHAGSQAPSLSGADAILNEAWAKFEERRYGEAILAAQKARELLNTLSR